MHRLLIMTLTAVALAAAVPALAQVESGEPRIRDFTQGPVTDQELIDALTPRDAPLHARDLPSAPPPPPDCAFYRQQQSRGITVKPAADIAAIKILFAFNSAELSPEASGNLDALGRALTSSNLSPCCFRIEGHTDSVGTEGYNRDLSIRRAKSVASYLSHKFGVDSTRLLLLGLGKDQPIADNQSDEGRQKNRRVQIVNLGYGQVQP
jgi:outer membrane protein OmpA-like peptidoglycan-associated protein